MPDSPLSLTLRRWLPLCLTCVLLGQFPGRAAADERELSEGELPVASDESPLSEESIARRRELDEILSLRQRHGNIFAGSILDADPSRAAADWEREFAQALRQIAERHAQQGPMHQAAISIPPDGTLRPTPAELPLPGSEWDGASDGPSPSTVHRSLLATARILEQHGADLDEAGDYEAADRSRRLARRIRREARRLDRATAAPRTADRPR